jgi:hypothetical protein
MRANIVIQSNIKQEQNSIMPLSFQDIQMSTSSAK